MECVHLNYKSIDIPAFRRKLYSPFAKELRAYKQDSSGLDISNIPYYSIYRDIRAKLNLRLRIDSSVNFSPTPPRLCP